MKKTTTTRRLRKLCAMGLAGVALAVVTAVPADAAPQRGAHPAGICRWLPWMCR